VAIQHAYVERHISQKLEKLFKHFPCVVVLGARQVGKSTLLQHVFPDIPVVVFDPVQDIQNARQDPDLFLANHTSPIILDEIQFTPELLPALKRFIDKSKLPGQYLLTGSQQWGILKTISESLAGRAVLLNLEGFSLAEISNERPKQPWLERWLDNPDAFLLEDHVRLQPPYSLYEQLWRGFLPETHFLELDLIADFHASYQRTYIERDVRVIADVSDLQLFGRFVRLLAAQIAQEINFSQLGRDIQLTPQTAKRWTEVLKQTFEWFEIPAFSNNAIKRVSSKPKGYFSDTGQVCFSQMLSSPKAIASHPLMGNLFENAVVAELRKQALLISSPPQFYHWRTYSGAECDLILERDGKLFPIEIKANSQPTKKDTRGIRTFRSLYPNKVQKGLIIAPTDTRYALTAEDFALPWDTA